MPQLIPYPIGDDPSLEPDLQAEYIREHLSPGEVLAELQELLQAIPDDASHPLFPVVYHIVTYGTTRASGKRSIHLELVGDRLESYIQVAIDSCVEARLREGD